MSPRHLTSIDDLSLEEIGSIFFLAEKYLRELAEPNIPYRVSKSTNACIGSVLATLFYEPSTRTRLSFESAMLRLGGQVISSTDPMASSTAKGESLADTIRMASAYADVLVLRHPLEGAAKFAAEYASVPLINAGDGAHEHPTQTLCDLFTIRRERGTLNDLTVALLGDLKSGRTAHSLAYALARYGANILLMPAKSLEFPDHVAARLQDAFGYRHMETGSLQGADERITGAFVPEGAALRTFNDIDVLYVTRFQKERSAAIATDYPTVNAAFLASEPFRNTLVLHPLPRVGELDPGFDRDNRAGYFRQASYGVPVRMALITFLLKEDGKRLASEDNSARTYDGIICGNANCISRDAGEPGASPNLESLTSDPPRLRCLYCGHEVSRA
jgi:aspartate carbamoyltransferase catalytic subunit